MSTQYTTNCFAIINLLLLNVIKTSESGMDWWRSSTDFFMAWKRLSTQSTVSKVVLVWPQIWLTVHTWQYGNANNNVCVCLQILQRWWGLWGILVLSPWRTSVHPTSPWWLRFWNGWSNGNSFCWRLIATPLNSDWVSKKEKFPSFSCLLLLWAWCFCCCCICIWVFF